MVKQVPAAENATQVPTQDLTNKLAVRASGISQAAQAETGRHNTAEEGISQQNANTEEATQAETARHNPVMESAEQQRIQNEAIANKNTAAYQKGELGIDAQRIAQDKQKLEATVGPIADVHTLDAEERQDSASLDKQELEAANQIKQDYNGVGGFVRHGFDSAEDALKDSQKQFAALRQSHGQMFQQKRSQIGGKGAAVGAGAPPPGTKVATQQHIADYAKAKGITLDQATKEFTHSGYKIQ